VFSDCVQETSKSTAEPRGWVLGRLIAKQIADKRDTFRYEHVIKLLRSRDSFKVTDAPCNTRSDVKETFFEQM